MVFLTSGYRMPVLPTALRQKDTASGWRILSRSMLVQESRDVSSAKVIKSHVGWSLYKVNKYLKA
jgi:hypothetical protein